MCIFCNVKRKREYEDLLLWCWCFVQFVPCATSCWQGRVHISIGSLSFFKAATEWGVLASSMSMLSEHGLSRCWANMVCLEAVRAEFHKIFSFYLLIRFLKTFNSPFWLGIESTTACYLKAVQLKQQRVCLFITWKQEWL